MEWGRGQVVLHENHHAVAERHEKKYEKEGKNTFHLRLDYTLISIRCSAELIFLSLLFCRLKEGREVRHNILCLRQSGIRKLLPQKYNKIFRL